MQMLLMRRNTLVEINTYFLTPLSPQPNAFTRILNFIMGPTPIRVKF